MSVSLADVKKAARLARIKLQENEIGYFQEQLSNIMTMIDQINEVDCANIEPFLSPNDMLLRARKDEVFVNNEIDEIFSNAPQPASDLARQIKSFVVPKVIE